MGGGGGWKQQNVIVNVKGVKIFCSTYSVVGGHRLYHEQLHLFLTFKKQIVLYNSGHLLSTVVFFGFIIKRQMVRFCG